MSSQNCKHEDFNIHPHTPVLKVECATCGALINASTAFNELKNRMQEALSESKNSNQIDRSDKWTIRLMLMSIAILLCTLGMSIGVHAYSSALACASALCGWVVALLAYTRRQ